MIMITKKMMMTKMMMTKMQDDQDDDVQVDDQDIGPVLVADTAPRKVRWGVASWTAG